MSVNVDRLPLIVTSERNANFRAHRVEWSGGKTTEVSIMPSVGLHAFDIIDQNAGYEHELFTSPKKYSGWLPTAECKSEAPMDDSYWTTRVVSIQQYSNV